MAKPQHWKAPSFTWATSSICAPRASAPSDGRLSTRRHRTGFGTGDRRPRGALNMRKARKTAKLLSDTGLKREMGHEIAGRQTFDRHRRPQDQRQTRRRILA